MLVSVLRLLQTNFLATTRHQMFRPYEQTVNNIFSALKNLVAEWVSRSLHFLFSQLDYVSYTPYNLFDFSEEMDERFNQYIKIMEIS